MDIEYPPVKAIPESRAWSELLSGMATNPLEFCASFPSIAQRFEAWWRQEIMDRPVFVGTANPSPSRPITRRLELLEHPEAWYAAKLADMTQLRYVGDALPVIRADFGPVLLGGLVGGRLEFGHDTGWTHPCIDDMWSNAPDWTLRDDNAWWLRLREVMRLVAEQAPGRYLACTPDLGGSADVLLNLRGAAGLCEDVMTRSERVRDAIDALYAAWRTAFVELYRIAMNLGAGLTHWLGIWSDAPYMVPACDFNYMIGPETFERLFLPDIARQAATVGRAVFHLDGPGATVHIDALLDVPDIQAIQFTPGTGTPSALAWVDMFRKIQARGRSLYIICPGHEALELCDALEPEGLGLWVCDAASPKELEDLFAAFCARFGVDPHE